MKKILIFLIISVLISCGFTVIGKINTQKESLLMKESILLSNPIFNDNGEYILLDFEDSTILHENGNLKL